MHRDGLPGDNDVKSYTFGEWGMSINTSYFAECQAN